MQSYPLTADRLQGAEQPIAPQIMIGSSFGHLNLSICGVSEGKIGRRIE
jgi:hypothetical protein